MELIAVMTDPSSSLVWKPSIRLKLPSEMDLVSFSMALSERTIFCEMKWLIRRAVTRMAQNEKIRMVVR